MFGIGGTELVIILLFAFLIVGPDKLPEIAKTLGKAVAKFRDTQDEMNAAIKKETDSIKQEAEKAQRKKEMEELRRETAEKRAAEEAASAKAEGSTTSDEASTSRAARVVRKDELGDAPAAAAENQEPTRQMSFSERKAAYEARQKAAKEKAEAEAAASASDGAASEPAAEEKEGE